jgi:amino acid adenylation domain-containing protein
MNAFTTGQLGSASAAHSTSAVMRATESSHRECIHELFEKQVQRTPHSPAVVFEDYQLTYSELNLRANRLAHYLRCQGVRREVPVAICLERSLEIPIAIMAILKAGGAYVPLDPDFPRARLAFILDDVKAPILITMDRLVARLPEHSAHVLCLDTNWSLIEALGQENPPHTTLPSNLAYVIYTSGSTGRPKGVAIEHRQLVNYIHAITKQIKLPATSHYAMASTFAADLGNTVLFPSLCSGGCLHLLSQECAVDPEAAAEHFKQNTVDCLKIVPSHLSSLLTSSDARLVLPRQRLILGGEALSWSLIGKVRQLAPDCTIINHYGPTETTVGAITHELAPMETGNDLSSVPLGQPIDGAEVSILTDDLRVAARDEAGEIYIGGAGVARGYLNRPALTAERFVPDPFSGKAGARLYRTGDRARYLPDGHIEFLGRFDHQVKIRGNRVELGEVEAALAEIAEVRDSVVIVREDEPGEKRLVAYIALRDRGHSITALRAKLKEKLPDYMVPSPLVLLESLPLTPNGKVDRSALPKPDQRPEVDPIRVAACDSLELQLVDIWEKVLSIQPIGLDDDFFDLGGDSILGARLFRQIENRFGTRLPLATLFQVATIAGLANLLRKGGWCPKWSSLVAIQPEGSRPPLYCVHACGAHVFIYRPLVRHLGLDQPVYGLQAQGLDGQTEPLTRLEDMAAHYVAEVRDFQPYGPYYLLGDTLGGLFALEMAHQLCVAGQQIALLAMLDTHCPLPLSAGQRVLSHLSHLSQLGVRSYLQAAAHGVKKKLTRRSESADDLPLTTAEQEYEQKVIVAEDPLARIEWAIYRATQINYVPPKPIPARITYFLARDNKYENRFEDNRLRWKTVAGGGFEVHVIPGRHDTIREEPHVAYLAEKLKASIDRVPYPT